ncbi:flagellar biosynthetic protein FliR [Rhodospirillum centenum]|uniref:Flagellar biosynthetic protein FliR n=1 Tax=Rhodospirillum centenum (strain ATCC 51521 / SW) TaxID=414684 RepID=B6IS88_RHOCS|nr:flagellar biosynthetic protein FliR [Rhodospirillum centenum]ACI98324.1 flagellar biosynthesis protein FliR [Rhodospirillum centenum SW]
MDLAAFVGGSVFAFLLVFVRLAAAFMIIPAIGEQAISARIRLLFALVVAAVVTPVVRQYLPPEPSAPAELAALVVSEILVGLFIGTLARVLLTALETGGFLIANQLGLAAAQAFNPALAAPGNPIGALLGIGAVVVIFATDLHHMLILAVVDSYTLFSPADGLPLGDATEHLAQTVNTSFAIGVQLAVPFFVIGFLFYLGLGLVARLVPQVQVFFVGLPIQIAIGSLMLSLSLSALMLFWLTHFEDQLVGLLRP